MKSQKQLPKDILQELIHVAEMAQKKSHSPYSKYKIGASLLTADGKVYARANVENSSYGATVCAERVAIWSAVTDIKAGNKKIFIEAICVVSSSDEAWPPCGMCRQVMSEFCNQDTLVVTKGTGKKYKTYQLGDLFPESFSAKFLKR